MHFKLIKITRNHNQCTLTNTENSYMMNTIRRIVRQKNSCLVAVNMRERHIMSKREQWLHIKSWKSRQNCSIYSSKKGSSSSAENCISLKDSWLCIQIWALKIVSHFRRVRLKILLRLYCGGGDERGEFSVVKAGYVWLGFFSDWRKWREKQRSCTIFDNATRQSSRCTHFQSH